MVRGDVNVRPVPAAMVLVGVLQSKKAKNVVDLKLFFFCAHISLRGSLIKNKKNKL